jgi:FkbM family methyltransferase
MYLNFSNKKFYFRPIIDHGNYSRFTFPQYIIIDDSDNRIEYIIDGGANIGSQSLRFMKQYCSTLKKIICIEPHYDNFKFLEKNLSDPKALNLNCALASKDDQKIYVSNFNKKDIAVNGKPTNISELTKTSINQQEFASSSFVNSITINTIIKNYNIPRIDFLKLDLNGFEEQIFKEDCSSWLYLCNSLAINNADLNNVSENIIKQFLNIKKTKIYNIDQMIILIDAKLNWTARKDYYKK